ncbi:polyamine ABC transporter substrate-binding protein [Labrys sp. KNU-23]|uniref:polyamine ABC transporter substrate-binding protein n=1 Tax=Labrys sp. KNU-23 TaxID=2789216 RepID=UPI0011ECC91D|nr:polyamine ABC transporter substrate-binding protein [Labrys sp. KNU-23]QEN89282.1 polyamine ABC transporter substrate-binding protein [Labrys sp. KNU-23]
MSAFKKLALAATAVALFAGQAMAEDKVVNVYNWSDYIGPTVLEDFTKETGIKVVYDTMDSNEVLETKLFAGNSGYDVVFPSATFASRQIKAGVFQKIDKSKLSNYKELWPKIMENLAVYDPGNEYLVDYTWFTTGISYNVDKAKAVYGDQPMNSWEVVFKPENLAKFKDCGVYFLDSPEDVLTAALKYQGKDPGSTDKKDIQEAGKMLEALRPYVKKFHSSEYINALANGDICIAIGWAGDTYQAKARAEEAKNGVKVDYVVPKEGTLMSMDTMAIPKDAKNVEAAHAFINYMLRPDVAAKNADATKFASGVLAAKPLVDKAITDNPQIYLSDEMLAKTYTVQPYGPKVQPIVTRTWTRVKTGQ